MPDSVMPNYVMPDSCFDETSLCLIPLYPIPLYLIPLLHVMPNSVVPGSPKPLRLEKQIAALPLQLDLAREWRRINNRKAERRFNLDGENVIDGATGRAAV